MLVHGKLESQMAGADYFLDGLLGPLWTIAQRDPMIGVSPVNPLFHPWDDVCRPMQIRMRRI